MDTPDTTTPAAPAETPATGAADTAATPAPAGPTEPAPANPISGDLEKLLSIVQGLSPAQIAALQSLNPARKIDPSKPLYRAFLLCGHAVDAFAPVATSHLCEVCKALAPVARFVEKEL